jgi:hypothetical protein
MHRTLVEPDDSLLDFALRLRFGWSPWQGFRSRFGRRVPLSAAGEAGEKQVAAAAPALPALDTDTSSTLKLHK